ncbi:MAG TPA: hypothetical protein DEA08_35080, partial [Planctomycetes bacterium]|nr:hypothetical protein [Planctomycetota bacterium]
AAAEALAEREGGEAARATFLELAEAGHAPAITRLAKQALLATPPDPAATERWLSRANAAGDVKAGEALGTLLFYGHAGLKQDRSRGLELLRAAAEAGRPNAALIYGSALCDGQGVAQDQEEGARWVQRAAEQGHPPALRTLGRLYRIGRGVGEDPALARRYLREAVAAGDMPAATKLAQLLAQGEGGEKDEAEALRLFRQAAEADPPDPLACCGLGELYRYGRGTPVDRVEAERWYRAAAELGMIEGKVSLAGMLIEPQDRSAADLARAEELLREPVAQGNRLGLANMAALYFVRRDMREGFRWSLKAAEAGDLQSMHNVAFMLSEGKVVPPDDRAAVRWYQRAAELGHAEAPLNLASHYFHGRGVERDLHAVARCYELALERLEPGANRDAAQSGLKDIRRRLARGER